MSWTCVVCSELHSDSGDVMGFGLCKECQKKTREKAALEALTRKNRFKKTNKAILAKAKKSKK